MSAHLQSKNCNSIEDLTYDNSSVTVSGFVTSITSVKQSGNIRKHYFTPELADGPATKLRCVGFSTKQHAYLTKRHTERSPVQIQYATVKRGRSQGDVLQLLLRDQTRLNIVQNNDLKPDVIEFHSHHDMAFTLSRTVTVSDLKELQIGN